MYDQPPARALARALTEAFRAGEWTADGLRARGREALAPAPRWLDGAVRVVLDLHHRPPRDPPRELTALRPGHLRALRPPRQPRVRRGRWLLGARGAMALRPPWPVPEIPALA